MSVFILLLLAILSVSGLAFLAALRHELRKTVDEDLRRHMQELEEDMERDDHP